MQHMIWREIKQQHLSRAKSCSKLLLLSSNTCLATQKIQYMSTVASFSLRPLWAILPVALAYLGRRPDLPSLLHLPNLFWIRANLTPPKIAPTFRMRKMMTISAYIFGSGEFLWIIIPRPTRLWGVMESSYRLDQLQWHPWSTEKVSMSAVVTLSTSKSMAMGLLQLSL